MIEKVRMKNRKSTLCQSKLNDCHFILYITFREPLLSQGWGTQSFQGLHDSSWNFPCGPIHDKLNQCTTTGKIFDVIWAGLSEHILEITLARETCLQTVEDVNLFLASVLVTGLSPQPEIADYFMEDTRGIFGSKWMQTHCTRDSWYSMNSHLHYDPMWANSTLVSNVQSAWCGWF
ncbi:MAG: hypothetical protein ACREBA_11550 [Nitrosotalea sp.]